MTAHTLKSEPKELVTVGRSGDWSIYVRKILVIYYIPPLDNIKYQILCFTIILLYFIFTAFLIVYRSCDLQLLDLQLLVNCNYTLDLRLIVNLFCE